MEQLILHLIGDYVTQTDWMAKNKINNIWIATCHAIVYTLPFLLITHSWFALAVICITHIFIDRYMIARYIIFFKNKMTDWTLRWEDCSVTGYHKSMPLWLSIWLMIICDNTLHLTINYLALNFL